ncbi:hypothetical protein ACWGJB_44630 [Streptomyces sp. NPDC054813]
MAEQQAAQQPQQASQRVQQAAQKAQQAQQPSRFGIEAGRRAMQRPAQTGGMRRSGHQGHSSGDGLFGLLSGLVKLAIFVAVFAFVIGVGAQVVGR